LSKGNIAWFIMTTSQYLLSY